MLIPEILRTRPSYKVNRINYMKAGAITFTKYCWMVKISNPYVTWILHEARDLLGMSQLYLQSCITLPFFSKKKAQNSYSVSKLDLPSLQEMYSYFYLKYMQFLFI